MKAEASGNSTSSLSHTSPRFLRTCTFPFLLSPAEKSQASTSSTPTPPNPLLWGRSAALREAGEWKRDGRGLDVQGGKHEKRRLLFDAVADASQHLRGIKATSASVAVSLPSDGGVEGGGCGGDLSGVCSCDLSSRPPGSSGSTGRAAREDAAEWTCGNREKWKRKKKKNMEYILSVCLCPDVSKRLFAPWVSDCRGKATTVEYLSTLKLSVYSQMI